MSWMCFTLMACGRDCFCQSALEVTECLCSPYFATCSPCEGRTGCPSFQMGTKKRLDGWPRTFQDNPVYLGHKNCHLNINEGWSPRDLLFSVACCAGCMNPCLNCSVSHHMVLAQLSSKVLLFNLDSTSQKL